MNKRTVIIGDYDTADNGWTLTGCALSAPEMKTNYVEKAGGDGSWDLSTAMTEGVPKYRDRSLVITLECSEGNRDHREELISELVNKLDGLEWPIVLPDHPDHQLTGRVHVAVDYSDLAHAAVTVTGVCKPWLESQTERTLTRTAKAEEQELVLINEGRRVLLPEIVVEGGSVQLRFGGNITQVSTGAYTWSALVLTPGVHKLLYSGIGTLTVRYREAVLR